MATYVLVHGAWHGAWCWYRTVALLQRDGHVAIAPDLKSLGRDSTPPGGITLELWVAQIAALVSAQAEPVVLVGHSRAGIVLSEVAERVPDRIRLLVYVTAFLLENGRCLQDESSDMPDSLVGPAMVMAEDHRTVSIREDRLRDVFYDRCGDADVVLAKFLVKPEPVAPLSTPVHITADRFGRVPRVYVECAGDRAITHAAQRRMQATLPCRERFTLDTDHSPFFSRTEELGNILLRLGTHDDGRDLPV